jgi:cytosine/adenosine deaminase-related metal-dependent hydrolase
MGERPQISAIQAGAWVTDPRSRGPFASRSARIENGRIVELSENAPAGPAIGNASAIALPAPIDAHDHGRGLRSLSYGHVDLPLEIWSAGHSLHPAADAGLIATVAFARIARGGAAGTVHLHRPIDYERMVDEARAVARAAAEIGIRLAFVVPMTDRQSAAYTDDASFLDWCGPADRATIERRLVHKRPRPSEQVALAEEIARAIAGPMVDVQLGPGGPQWCSDDLLAAIAEHSAVSDRRIHMHLLETRRQREWGDAHHAKGLLPHLDDLGLLSPRLSVAHGVWLDAADLALLAARGVKVAVNISSNLRLRSGLVDLAAFKRHGVRFAIGLDGLTLEDEDDVLREMRLAFLLNAGTQLDPNLDIADILDAAAVVGREVLDGTSMAAMRAGADADVLLIDRDRLVPDLIADAGDDLDIAMLRATRRHVSHLVVAGREIVRDGEVLGTDLAAAERELLAMARALAPNSETLDFVRRHRERLKAFYQAGLHLGGR